MTSRFVRLSAVETPSPDLRTTVLGTPLSMPMILAPVGSSRMFYPRGEEVAARAAGEAGTLYTLSTLSGCLLEDVRRATNGPAWYQVYLCGGRDVASGAIERARNVGLFRARRHHRYARWRACASATCATGRRSC